MCSFLCLLDREGITIDATTVFHYLRFRPVSTQSFFFNSYFLPQYGQFFDLKELKLAPQDGHWIFAMEKFVENGTSVLLAAVI